MSADRTGSGTPAAPPAVRPSLAAFLVFLAVLTALPYLPALRYGFVYDDDVQVVNNPAIRNWGSVPAYFVSSVWGFHDPAAAKNYYRPLFFLWLRLNDALFGQYAPGWHITSLALHLAETLLVFSLLHRHFRDPRIAAAGALLFGVHPVHIESVVWVSGATDALAALGVLGSLLLWLRLTGAPRTALRLAALACYAASLLCKETSIVLPAIIFLYVLAGVAPGAEALRGFANRFRRAVRETLPLLGVTLFYLAARFAVLHGFRQESHWLSARTVFFSAPALVLFYLRQLVWPAGLSLFYDFPLVGSPGSSAFWLPLIVLSLAAACAWLWWRRTRDAAIPAAAAWFALPLLPVLNIAFFQQDDFVHDRYLYLPSIALALVCCSLLKSFRRFAAADSAPRSLSPSLGIAALLIAALSIATAAQASPWRDNLSLYSHAVARAPRNTMARNNLASQFAERGRLEEAAAIFGGIVLDRPDFWLANYNLGYVNYCLKRLDAAETFLRRAIVINPLDADQYSYLGMTYYREGRLPEAATQLRLAIARKPAGAGYHIALGMVLLQQGDRNAAKAAFLEELRYHPDSQPASQQLALVEQALASVPSSPPR
jgi:tetratricopeptide (TPR) repeat protein